MSMAAVPPAVGARVDHRRARPRGKYVITAVSESDAAGRRGRGSQPLELPDTLSPEQPDRLLAQAACARLPVATTVYGRGCGKRIEQMFRAVPASVEQAAAVVIAEARRLAAGTDCGQAVG